MEMLQVKINNPKAKKILTNLADLNLITISEEEIFPLTRAQKKSISISRKQIKKGEIRSHKSVISEMKRWLKSK